MPIYEYECPECKNREERLVPFTEAGTQVCNLCQRLLVRLVSKPGPALWVASCPTSSGGKPCK